MKVIAAINGSISAESMAFYALKFAEIQNSTLILLHVKNVKDDLDDVKSSIERITLIAASHHVQVETVFLEKPSDKIIKDFLIDSNIDTIFCTTRKYNKFITNSFSEVLIKMNLNIDIAVMRIVKINNTIDTENILLSINEDKLSAKKFTFFATLASAYKANTEIYSVTKMSRYNLSKVDIHEARNRLTTINYNLRHYIKLSNFMPFNLHIKHDFTSNEKDSILTKIAKSDVQLLIVGAKRLSEKSFFAKESTIEKLMREVSVNTIAYYTKE